MNLKRTMKKAIVVLLSAIVIVTTCFGPGTLRASAATVYVDRKADVVFVIDISGSMGSHIDSVKSHLSSFISTLDAEDVDVRVKFVTYSDITEDETTVSSEWYTDVAEAISYLEGITLLDGGDAQETLLDGLGKMIEDAGFREDAAKFNIILTDASSKIENNYGYTCENEVIHKMNEKLINTSVISASYDKEYYDIFVTKDGGVWADISGDYSIILNKVVDSVIEAIENLKVYEIYPTSGLVGNPQTVDVIATGVKYDEVFSVTVGNQSVTELTETGLGFKFKVPSDLTVGKYDIEVVNGKDAEPIVIGEYSYVETLTDYDYKVFKIEPSTATEGEKVSVKVTVDMIDYVSDFSVSVGGQVMNVTSKNTTYFCFDVPGEFSVGKHSIVVENSSKKMIGYFTVTQGSTSTTPSEPTTPPETPAFEIESLSQTSSEEGKAVQVKIIFKESMSYEENFGVTIGGVEAPLVSGKRTTKYAYCTVPSSLAIGSYELKVINGTKEASASYEITAKPATPAFEIESLSRASSEEGETVQVKVTYKESISYEDNFKVTIGGVEAPLVSGKKTTKYVYCTVPSYLTAGSYELKVTNGTAEACTSYEIVGASVTETPVFEIESLSQTSSEEGKAVQVKIIFKESMSYEENFGVTIGGVEAPLVSGKKTTKYVYCTVPSELTAGSYELKVTNGTAEASASYEITAKPATPAFEIMSLSRTSSAEGEVVQVKITYKESITYEDNFKVTIGGVEAPLVSGKKTTKYVYCKVPSGLAAGSYELKVINGTAEACVPYNIVVK